MKTVGAPFDPPCNEGEVGRSTVVVEETVATLSVEMDKAWLTVPSNDRQLRSGSLRRRRARKNHQASAQTAKIEHSPKQRFLGINI